MTEDNTDLGDDQLREELAAEAESADDTENKAEEEAEETEASGDQGAKGEETETEAGKFEDKDDPEIPVKRNASYIIQRQKDKIEKLRSQQQPPKAENDSTAGDKDEEEEADDTGDDKIAQEVSRQLKPFTDKMKADTDEAELADLFAAEPAAKDYEKTIRAYMKHPAWAQVPPTAIYHHLAFQHAQKQGAKQRQVADAEAAETSGAGSTRRSAKAGRKSGEFPSADEIDAMTDEQLDELAHKVQTGQFAKKK